MIVYNSTYEKPGGGGVSGSGFSLFLLIVPQRVHEIRLSLFVVRGVKRFYSKSKQTINWQCYNVAEI